MGRRALAWGLILYGVAGVILVIAGAIVGLDVGSRVERLAGDADGTLAAAARATEASADAFENVDASLDEAEASATAAATLAREAAGTLRSLALTMELSVLGAQPLLPLAADFVTSADQADDLANTLTSVGSSLGDTRADTARISAELETLGTRLEDLRGSSGAADGDPPPLRLFIGLLLAWLAVPALASLVTGLTLLRRRPAGVTVVGPTAPPPGGAPRSIRPLEDPAQAHQRTNVQDDADRE